MVWTLIINSRSSLKTRITTCESIPGQSWLTGATPLLRRVKLESTIIKPSLSLYFTDYEAQYWNLLSGLIPNEIGRAALMGNLYAESNLIPYRLEGDFTQGYTLSMQYTNNVDSGAITKETFINDGKGYGVAQWTFSSRKETLYNLWKTEAYDSIGSLVLSVEMLTQELNKQYVDVLNELRNAADLRAASDYVLFNFENPDDKSEAVQLERYNYSKNIYDKYAGKAPEPIVKSKSKLWMYLRREG